MKLSVKSLRRSSAASQPGPSAASPEPEAAVQEELARQGQAPSVDLWEADQEAGAGGVSGDRRLPILLRRAWYGLNQAFRRRIAHTGSTPDQFTVMRNLAEGDARGLTQRQLTGLMSSDPNTIAALTERMETAGLIERRPHERDGRSHRIRLRPRGLGRYRELVAIAMELQDDVLASLPESRRPAFLKDLTCVADACRALADDERRRSEGG